MPRIYKTQSPIDRIAARTVKRPNGCHEYMGAVNNKGYGVVSMPGYGRGVVMYAHRIVLAHKLGIDPIKLDCSLHKCDNPRCVNPKHLIAGTDLDNVRDMDAKGRRVSLAMRGEAHPLCKLTDKQVAAIRADLEASPRYPSGRMQYGVVRDLAEKYGVSRTRVSELVKTRLAKTSTKLVRGLRHGKALRS